MLVDQPTNAPVRKIWAVIISGAIVAALQSVLTNVPEWSGYIPVLDEAGVWIQFAVMSIAGYMTKENI